MFLKKITIFACENKDYVCEERGLKSPLFNIKKMAIQVKEITSLVQQTIENSDVFIVDIQIRPGNKISVFLDADNAITIEKCKQISRFIESNLDREKEDFELIVSSAGIGNPLKIPRQYKNKIGKEVEVIAKTGIKEKGILLEADDKSFKIEVLKGKKKEAKKEIIAFNYEDIKETKEIIRF